MFHPDYSGQRRLLLIKIVHTAVWIFFVVMFLHVVWSGITANITASTWVAIALVVVEGLTLMLFKGRCPLTIVARKYSSSAKDNFDIFLPEWLARYNKLIFSALFIVGVMLVLVRLI